MARKRKRRSRRPPPPSPAEAPPPGAAEAPRPARERRPLPGERPPAPWGRFPLVELAVLVALALLIGGFAAGQRKLVLVGLAVGSLAGLEVSVREHFAGYRSHTLLLSGAVAIGMLLLLAAFVPSLWLPIALGIALIAFAATAWVLTGTFRRRSGVSFRVKPR